MQTIRDPFSGEMKDIDNLIAEIGGFDAELESMGLLSVPTAPARPPDVAVQPVVGAAPPAVGM